MNYKHGLAGTRARESWHHMMARCYDESHDSYKYYGGRGIRVCDRWHELANFHADMGEPLPGLSLDRIDNDGDYEPGNCRWATSREQARNKSSNRYLEFRGQSKLISEWAKECGLLHATLTYRLKRGMSVEEALTTPLLRRRNKKNDPASASLK